MADILSIVSLISFILSGVAFVLAILFFIMFRIPSVIGDLSGRTAKKSIARMRATNEKTGNKSFKTSSTNAERGTVTDTMHGIKRKNEEKPIDPSERPDTGLLVDNKAEAPTSEATGLLIDEDATAPLDTTVRHPVNRTGGKKLTMIEEVVFVHTDEVI